MCLLKSLLKQWHIDTLETGFLMSGPWKVFKAQNETDSKMWGLLLFLMHSSVLVWVGLNTQVEFYLLRVEVGSSTKEGLHTA